MKIKAKIKKGVLKVKTLIKHDMITYDQAAKKFGDRNKANFVTHITAKVGDKVVYDASTSQFLSKNPIIKFQAKAAGIKKGDKIEMTVSQKIGKAKTEKAKIK